MKKIYTMIGQQKLEKSLYGNENQILFSTCKEKVYFPITAYLSSILEDAEKCNVVVIDSFDSTESNFNYELLQTELDTLFKNQIRSSKINAVFSNNQKGQIAMFKQIYQSFEENDEIYFDITFGLKPTPMTTFVSCNYAQKFIKNISIENMIYAHYNFNGDSSYIHPIIDITSIFLLNNIIDTLSEMKSDDPTKFIDSIFNLDNE